MRIFSQLVVAVLLNASLASAQTLDDELRAQVARYVQTVNAGDPDALARLYLDRPAVATLGDGHITAGPAAVSTLLQRIYQQLGSIRMTVDSLTVMPLGRDAGLAFFRYRWIMGRAEPQAAWGAMTLVFLRTSDGWRVAHDHTSSLPADSFGVLPQPTLADSGPPAPVRETFTCVVSRIADGDTFECSSAGRVRPIGVDAPELSQAPYGAMAMQALASLVPVGSEVELELDVERRDQYDRLLAYVWADGVMVNWLLVRLGWAVVLTYPPNVQYVDWLNEAQRQAREEGVGLWAIDAFECLPRDRRQGRCD